MRRRPARVAAVLLALSLAACSGSGATSGTGDTDDDTAPQGRAAPANPHAGRADPSGFPVTIEHMLGEAVIDAPPERVVALGPAEGDIALALGVTPVAMVGNPYSDDGRFPWVGEEYDLTSVEMLPFEVTRSTAEGLVDLRPDVILATTATADPDLYDQAVAFGVPVVAPVAGPVQDSWQDLTRTIGRALGRSERADELIAEVEGAIADTRADLPELAGRTFVVASAQGGGNVRVVDRATDTSARLFADLGMVLPPPLEAVANDTVVGATDLSEERVDLLDGDALFLSSVDQARDELERSPLFQALHSVHTGAYLPYDNDQALGVRVPSPLSVPYVLEVVRPTLEVVAASPPADLS